jgi:uncharacterized protein (TIGR02246 family)
MSVSTDETAIEQLMDELAAAWNRGDAAAYAARYLPDGTFTNVNGTWYSGRDEFRRRHEETFQGYLKGTTIALQTRKVRFIRPEVAVADVDVCVSGVPELPPGLYVSADGALHSSSLLVLVRDSGTWWIASYHSVWRAAGG